MPKREFDALEFRRIVALGGRVSQKHRFFKVIAKLGYVEAEKRALLEFWKWLQKHPKATVEQMLEKYLEYVGMARYLPNSKEVTRLSMILGDSFKIEDY